MIVLGLGSAHRLFNFIAVAARTDIGRNHHWCLRGLMFVSQVRNQRSSRAIGPGKSRARIAELLAPVRTCTPRRAFQDEAGAVAFGNRDVALVVVTNDSCAPLGLEQIEAREERQIDAILENQRGLKAAIGEKRPAAQLRKPSAIFRHDVSFNTCAAEDLARTGQSDKQTRGQARALFFARVLSGIVTRRDVSARVTGHQLHPWYSAPCSRIPPAKPATRASGCSNLRKTQCSQKVLPPPRSRS